MSYEPHLIAPYGKGSGLDLYHKAWLIGDAAFERLDDAFTWRGSIRKRDGFNLLARIPVQVNINAISNANPAVVTTSAAHGLQNGDQVWLEGIEDADYLNLNNTLFNITVILGTTFSLQTLLGVNVDESASVAPAGIAGAVHLPVQHLGTRIITNTLDEQLLAFTSTRVYLFNTGTSAFDNVSFFQTSGAAFPWTGGANAYHWSTNFASSVWVTNNVDPVRFYNGSTTQGWNNQRFQTNGTPQFVHRALMIIPFKGRLVLLNTGEGIIGPGPNFDPTIERFSQRARWSQIGTPYVTATSGDPVVVLPVATFGGGSDVDAWRSDIQGRGGFVDAATAQQIVSAEVVNDNLIVFFERSTWRLRYTGVQILPFVWEEINSHYGSESTHGTVGFDQVAFTFSRFGFIGADTNNVRRIDKNIPDISFQVETGATNQELQRVAATRDFYRNMFYWAYPDAASNAKINNRVLVYNYDEQTWSKFNMSLRTFGSYKAFEDVTWANTTTQWMNTNRPWNLGQSNFPQVVAGTESGRVDIVFEAGPGIDDRISTITGVTVASPAVITTTANHGLNTGDTVIIDNIVGTMSTVLNDITHVVTYLTATTFSVPVDTSALAYTSGGTVTPTDSLFGFDIRTKRFNPYIKEGQECRLQYVDVYVTGTSVGEATLEHYINADDSNPVETVTFSTAIAEDSRYTRLFLGESAQFHQLRLFLSAAQLADDDTAAPLFELQGMVIWTRPGSRIKKINFL